MPNLFCTCRVPALLLLGALALPATGQVAAPPASPADSTTQWGIGAGVNIKRQGYAGVGSKTTGIPLLSYENQWLRFAGPTLDLKAPLASPLALALRARYAFEDGYEASDASALAGMDERKSSLWLGLALGWRGEYANASAEWLADAGSHSGGKRARASIDKPLRAGPFLISPRVALNWVDRDYVDYYYGVRASEARAGRPMYAGDAALNAELGVRMAYRFGSGHSVYGDVSVTRLDDAIADSPLVDRQRESALRLGYLYQFR